MEILQQCKIITRHKSQFQYKTTRIMQQQGYCNTINTWVSTGKYTIHASTVQSKTKITFNYFDTVVVFLIWRKPIIMYLNICRRYCRSRGFLGCDFVQKSVCMSAVRVVSTFLALIQKQFKAGIRHHQRCVLSQDTAKVREMSNRGNSCYLQMMYLFGTIQTGPLTCALMFYC